MHPLSSSSLVNAFIDIAIALTAYRLASPYHFLCGTAFQIRFFLLFLLLLRRLFGRTSCWASFAFFSLCCLSSLHVCRFVCEEKTSYFRFNRSQNVPKRKTNSVSYIYEWDDQKKFTKKMPISMPNMCVCMGVRRSFYRSMGYCKAPTQQRCLSLIHSLNVTDVVFCDWETKKKKEKRN